MMPVLDFYIVIVPYHLALSNSESIAQPQFRYLIARIFSEYWLCDLEPLGYLVVLEINYAECARVNNALDF